MGLVVTQTDTAAIFRRQKMVSIPVQIETRIPLLRLLITTVLAAVWLSAGVSSEQQSSCTTPICSSSPNTGKGSADPSTGGPNVTAQLTARVWTENANKDYLIEILGSTLQARQRKIGGAIYRQAVDWLHESYKHGRKPLEHAAQGKGADMLTIYYDLAGRVLHLRLAIHHEYLDTVEVDFALDQVERTETDTLKEMLGEQERRLQEALDFKATFEERLDQALALIREEIRKELAPVYLSVSSGQTSACVNRQMVQWNGLKPDVAPRSHFALSTDRHTVTIAQAGIYQVHVRLAGTQSGSSGSIASGVTLLVNGVEFAQCVQTDTPRDVHRQISYLNSAHISEILPMTQNATLQVRCPFSESFATELTSRLTILYLGPLQQPDV